MQKKQTELNIIENSINDLEQKINFFLKNKIKELETINVKLKELEENGLERSSLYKRKHELLLIIYLNYRDICGKISSIREKNKELSIFNRNHNESCNKIFETICQIDNFLSDIINQCTQNGNENNMQRFYEEYENTKETHTIELENDILELEALLKVYFKKQRMENLDFFYQNESTIYFSKWKEAKKDLIDFLSNEKFNEDKRKEIKNDIEYSLFNPLLNIVLGLYPNTEHVAIFKKLKENMVNGLNDIEEKIESKLNDDEDSVKKTINAFYQSVAFSQFNDKNKDHFLSELTNETKLRQKNINIKDNPLVIDIVNSIVTNNEYNEALISLLKETTCTAEDFKEEKKYNSLNYLKYTLIDKVLSFKLTNMVSENNDNQKKEYIEALSRELNLFTPEVLKKLQSEIESEIGNKIYSQQNEEINKENSLTIPASKEIKKI